MYEIYTIEEFDTIDTIANKFGVNKELLYQINGLSDNYSPQPNTQIIVPSTRNQTFTYYTVKKGDNLYQISKQYNVDYDLLLKLNGLDKDDYIYPNQTILLPRAGLTLYITKEGDTLNSILDTLNTNITALINQNKYIYLQPEQLITLTQETTNSETSNS